MKTNEIVEKIKNKESLENLFVELTGSEKQIKWAESLRRAMLKESIEEVEESIEDGDGYEEFVEKDAQHVIEILTESDAGEIISWHVG